MKLVDICENSYRLAVEKHWWRLPVKKTDILHELYHLKREVDEAIDEINKIPSEYTEPNHDFELEMADVFILASSICRAYGINIEAAVAEKHEINKKR